MDNELSIKYFVCHSTLLAFNDGNFRSFFWQKNFWMVKKLFQKKYFFYNFFFFGSCFYESLFSRNKVKINQTTAADFFCCYNQQNSNFFASFFATSTNYFVMIHCSFAILTVLSFINYSFLLLQFSFTPVKELIML